jgi:uncharacterized membrane protein
MTIRQDKVFSYVSSILLVGSYCAAGLLFLGLSLLFLQGNSPGYQKSTSHPSFSTLVPLLVKGDPTAVISFGILVMMFTPFLRVVVAGFSFLVERDFKYALIAFGVMLILLFTIAPSFV